MNDKNTRRAILKLTHKIPEAIEKREIPIGLLLDLTKAFDCVNYSRLLEKLEAYGIKTISSN